MSRFLIGEYKALEEYTPGEQPRDRKYIKLNTNESPYPPSGGVLNAVSSSEAALLRLYPDPTCSALKEGLAELFGLKSENVFVTNSSDDVLNMAFTAFAGRVKPAYYADITYGFYKVFAALHGCKSVVFPLKNGFKLDCSDYMGLNGGLIAIANPNAPTGLEISLDEIRRICLSSPECVVLIDEAYIDFGGTTAIPLLSECENLVVCRTFSKSASMAGARLGFALASGELTADLEKIKYSTNPYSVNRITLAAGEAAVKDADYYRSNCRRIISTRQKTAKALAAIGFEMTDSKANFLFARYPGLSGKEIFDRLKKSGILVRRFDQPRIEDYLRITIGSENEMETLVNTLERIVGNENS